MKDTKMKTNKKLLKFKVTNLHLKLLELEVIFKKNMNLRSHKHQLLTSFT